MLRVKAIQTMVSLADCDCVFQNMQTNGLKTPHPLNRECFALTSAMGNGGGQTPLIVKVYD